MATSKKEKDTPEISDADFNQSGISELDNSDIFFSICDEN